MEFERCDQQREPTEQVGEFAVYELLGAGAFGSVCRVRCARNCPLNAMKQVCAVCTSVYSAKYSTKQLYIVRLSRWLVLREF